MPGLCECTCGNFCLSCWCPCVASGRIAAAASNSTNGCCVYYLIDCTTGCGMCYHAIGPARNLRKNFNVDADENPCCTCCRQIWCCCCAFSMELGFIDTCKQNGVPTGPQRQVMVMQTVAQ